MNILVFANSVLFKSVISGGDIILPQMMKYFKSNHFNLHVITTKRGKQIWQDVVGTQANFYLLPNYFLENLEYIFLVPVLYMMRLFFCLIMLPKIIVTLNKPLILYTSSDFFPDVIPAFCLKMTKNVWLSRIYHIIKSPFKRKGNIIFNILSFLGQRFSFLLIKHKSTKILTLSGTYKSLIKLNFPKEKLFVSDIGIDIEAIKKIPYYKENFDGIYIGGILPTKGTYDLIYIWKEVVKIKPDAKLAIIGGATQKIIDKFKLLIFNERLQENIRYFGYVEDKSIVYSILKSSKIYLCPGHENGFSIPVLEAMACGIPVIAYKLDMFGTAFKKGYITVDIYDKEGFVKAVLELLETEQERMKLSQEAFEESERFDWRQISKEFTMLLECCLKSNEK